MATLEQAVSLAAVAHAGQKDKGGEPYILHPLRVMLAVQTHGEAAMMAAVLHDTVEDTSVTLTELRDTGYPEEVVDAVDALTRRGRGPEKEPYMDFIKRCGANSTARMVKMADLLDNLNEDRLAKLEERFRAKLVRRYEEALDHLLTNTPN